MKTFNFIIKFINLIISPLGLKFEKIRNKPWNWINKTDKILVGKYFIEMPSHNTLVENYTKNASYSSHIGRLTTLVYEKYNNLCVVDIGANVGDTASVIKSAADVPVICIEGDEKSFHFLERNIKQFKNVSAHLLFLGERSETIGANIQKSGWNLTINPNSQNPSIMLNLRTFDEFVETHELCRNIKLIKIDTEGFDCAILRGAKNSISKTKPILTFEYNRDNLDPLGENGLATLDMLETMGYKKIVFHDCFGRYICSTILSNHSLLNDLNEYADGHLSAVIYYDVTVFSIEDSDLADRYIAGEKKANNRKNIIHSDK